MSNWKMAGFRSAALFVGIVLLLPSFTAQASASSAAKQTIPSGQAEEAIAGQSAKSIMTAAGKSLKFSKVMRVKATAYSNSPEENSWGPIDRFGSPLKLGTIAVDPKVIPFGTRLYITGYDFDGLPKDGMIATATDSGSAIKGNRIDIFIPGSRKYVAAFGQQNVIVYILK